MGTDDRTIGALLGAGRSGRATFWLVHVLAFFHVSATTAAYLPSAAKSLLSAPFVLAAVVVAIRRLHDLGLPGWSLALRYAAAVVIEAIAAQVPIRGGAVVALRTLITAVIATSPGFRRGDQGANDYGEPPGTLFTKGIALPAIGAALLVWLAGLLLGFPQVVVAQLGNYAVLLAGFVGHLRCA